MHFPLVRPLVSVLNAIVLRRLPFERPHELMRLYLQMPPQYRVFSIGISQQEFAFPCPKYIPKASCFSFTAPATSVPPFLTR